jgi:hypothetical protein
VKPGLGLSLQVASPEVIFRKLEAVEDRDIAAYEGLTSVLDDKSLPHSRSPATHLLEEGYDIEGYDIFLDKAGTLT